MLLALHVAGYVPATGFANVRPVCQSLVAFAGSAAGGGTGE